MTPAFQSFCPDCYEPVTYSGGRANTHDCIDDDTDEREDD